ARLRVEVVEPPQDVSTIHVQAKLLAQLTNRALLGRLAVVELAARECHLAGMHGHRAGALENRDSLTTFVLEQDDRDRSRSQLALDFLAGESAKVVLDHRSLSQVRSRPCRERHSSPQPI